ncbi:MAG: hypothetical protein MUF49_31930 [Oculatellaceae cyanobacterium Prado106]|nr:hypothetical protein [Oculatellaceae cyanobacterium Prado106]
MADASQTPNSSTQYAVSIWEAIAIFTGAILLVAVGVAGLGVKALNNAFDPRRAEAIAQSLVDYRIPGGSTGTFGANFGGAKVAVVTSTRTTVPGSVLTDAIAPPAVELFVARIPINEVTQAVETEEDLGNEFFSGFSFSSQGGGEFQPQARRIEPKQFCETSVPVTIQEGSLVLPDASVIPAVQYETRILNDSESYIAVISALGTTAAQDAAAVFDSLQCKL